VKTPCKSVGDGISSRTRSSEEPSTKYKSACSNEDPVIGEVRTTEVVVAGADVSGELSSKGMSLESISSTAPDFGTAHEVSTMHSAANRKVFGRLTMISLQSLQT
jgi:hypothetical protein